VAYKNLINQLCLDKTEMFCRIRDFICKRNGTYDYSTDGIGWTLWDSVYAVDEDNPQIGDYFVITSAGESGNEDLYFKFEWTSGAFRVRGFQSWDPSTHAGSARYFANVDNYYALETISNIYLNIRGDLDFLISHYKLTTNDHRVVSFGAIESAVSGVDRTIATCASALSAGSDVSITVDSVPASWEVGREIFIRTVHTDNMATVEMETITIKTLVGNTITADLVDNYTAGSKLCVFVDYICQGATSFAAGYNFLKGASSSINPTCSAIAPGLTTSYTDPTAFENRYALLTFILQPTTTGTHSWPLGMFKHILYIGAITAPMVDEDVVEALDGSFWRILSAYSNKRVGFREV